MTVEFKIEAINALISAKSLLVFDFDGVLSDSVEVKTDAFAALYQSYGSDISQQVIDHHRENGGMSRFEKFRVYHSTFLNKDIDDAGIAGLSAQFSDLVVEKVIAANEISGATSFLKANTKKTCVINSATPTEELHKIVVARGLSPFFQASYGSPVSKQENLSKIFQQFEFTANDGVFFGDASSDFNAAKSMGMDFVGVGQDIAELLSHQEGTWYAIDNFNGLVNGA
jgi:phosphoglycolate phosphatase-like HAD superfamily hydrolase